MTTRPMNRINLIPPYDDNVSTEDFKVEVPTTPVDTLLVDEMIDGLQVEELVLTEEEEQKQKRITSSQYHISFRKKHSNTCVEIIHLYI